MRLDDRSISDFEFRISNFPSGPPLGAPCPADRPVVNPTALRPMLKAADHTGVPSIAGRVGGIPTSEIRNPKWEGGRL
jgi:hypothetical protein